METQKILQKVIETSGLSTYRIAQITDYKESQFSYWKSGKRTPKLETICDIANKIGVKVSVSVEK